MTFLRALYALAALVSLAVALGSCSPAGTTSVAPTVWEYPNGVTCYGWLAPFGVTAGTAISCVVVGR